MIAIYLIHLETSGGGWYDVDRESNRTSRVSLLHGAARGAAWVPPEVEWRMPLVAAPGITPYSHTLAVERDGNAGARSILERSGALLDLGGDGAGWQAYRPFERLELVDTGRCLLREDLRESYATPPRPGAKPVPVPVSKYRFFEDRLVPNTVARAHEFVKLISIEEEGPSTDVTDPAKCGFRAWVKHHGVTGVRFKKVWDSTDTIDFDHLWFHKSLGDDAYEWD